MVTKTKRTARKQVRKTNSRQFRVVRAPRTDRSWLLASTALIAGVMGAGMVGATPAFADSLGAACNVNTDNYYTCAGPEAGNLILTPDGNFQVDLGPNPNGNPFNQTVNTANPALTIYADGNVTDNEGIHLYPRSSIDNAGGIGLALYDAGDGVDLHIDDTWGNEGWDASSITGTTGIYIASSVDTEDGLLSRVHVMNNGHVEGTAGAGLEATGYMNGSEDVGNALILELDNHSYGSMVGAVDGTYIHDDIVWTQINNGNGLLAGLTGQGIKIVNVDNNDPNHAAVQINNNHAGVVAGYANGVYVSDVAALGDGNADVNINNDAYYDDGDQAMARGGLIVGTTEDGVALYNVDGRININNAGTLGDAFDLSVLDPLVYNTEDGLLDDGFLFGGIDPTMGIWGQYRGIDINDVGQSVSINNGSYFSEDGNTEVGGGLIVGVNDDAVHISDVEGIYNEDGDNSWYQAVDIGNDDGLMWGGDDGVHVYDADGNVNVNNWGGTIFGVDEGVHVADTWRGDVFVGNGGGRIEGFYGDAIHIWDVDSSNGYGGWAGISNGNFGGDNEEWGTNGGLIWGADRAIYINSERAWVGNGIGGMIIGDGDWQQPVLELRTSNDENNGADIYNAGLMTSSNIPHLVRGWTAPGATDVPADPLDAGAIEQLLTDYADVSDFVWSGGQSGDVANLVDYSDAASDVLLWSRGGAVDFTNGNTGVMIGRVNMDGHNDTEDGWPNVRGNTIRNFGTWLTVDNGQWGNEMHGSANDEIQNAGLIQTAFEWDVYETASFGGVNRFINGGYYEDGYWADYGLLSMTDGGTGDYTWIDHDFRGSQYGELTSFVGMDVNFGPAAGPVDGMDPSTWRADYLNIYDTIDGTTGLIINKVGSEGTDLLGDRIYVAYASWDDNPSDMMCFDRACAEGDTMYIDASSEGYINVDGVGAIQDGFYAWYLYEEEGITLALTEAPSETAVDPDFVLESTWAPQALQLPSLITGAQNIWHDTSGQVADHIYGTHFPLSGNGGGGADLPVGELPLAPDAPDAAVWLKATGSWTDRNTEVTEIIPPGAPVTIDTSFVQDTFSILGGADFQPMGGGDDGVRLGVFGGFVTSNLDFDSYDAAAAYSGGIIGGYAAFTSGGFYADAEVKADLLQVTYTAPISPGFETTGASTSIGILANTGYRMDLGSTAFFEPIASVSFVSTQLDGFDAGGASVEFSNGESLQAGIGARAGVTLGTPGDTTTEVSVLGKVWNEFEEANEITISDGINSTTFSDDIGGVFGEISGMATMYSADRTFSAFGSTGVKFNENFTTIDAKVGVRKGF